MIDLVVLVTGSAVVAIVLQESRFAATVIAIVTIHFFLFCNVFRIQRSLELVWAGLFVGFVGLSIATGIPPWVVTILIIAATTLTVIGIGIRKPSYHGVFWRMINPKLPDWWNQQTRN